MPHILNELEQEWRRSDAVFALLAADAALYERPIPLRHPPIFYLGHLAAFAWNHLGTGVLGHGPVDARLDSLFARGIDPHDEREAGDVSVDESLWPSPDETRAYRDSVRSRVREAARELAGREDVLAERDRVLHLIIEHEQMHHETLVYLFKRMPDSRLVSADALPEGLVAEGPAATSRLDPEAPPEQLVVPGGEVVLGAEFDGVDFGWDNEFPATPMSVDEFSLDAVPVTVARYRRFVRETGSRPPIDWFEDGGRWFLRTLPGALPLDDAGDLPVHVTKQQADSFAAHAGGRLPTEAELHRAAYGHGSPFPWGAEVPEGRSNVGWRRLGSAPVGAHPAGRGPYGHYELVGNGWEWTSTPFAPLPGFRPWIRTYPGYSADFFDGNHFVVFGGAWPTADRLLRPSFRNWYFEHYDHAFTTFRLVR